MGQVFSQNVVGYYNITVPANQFTMIANQFNTANNTIGALLPSGPPAAQLFKYSGAYTVYTFDDLDLVWKPDANATLNPGEGAFFKSPTATTITFVGEVPQGKLTNAVPINAFAIRSSMVPQSGGITSVLGFPAEGADQVFIYRGGYTVYTFDDLDLVWKPSEPSPNVGEAFFVKKAAAGTQGNWVRDFTVQ